MGIVAAGVLPQVTARVIVNVAYVAIREHLDPGNPAEDDVLARRLGHACWFTMFGR